MKRTLDFIVLRGPRFLARESHGDPLSSEIYEMLKLENEFGWVAKGEIDVEVHKIGVIKDSAFKAAAELLFEDSNLDQVLAQWHSSIIASDVVLFIEKDADKDHKPKALICCSIGWKIQYISWDLEYLGNVPKYDGMKGLISNLDGSYREVDIEQKSKTEQLYYKQVEERRELKLDLRMKQIEDRSVDRTNKMERCFEGSL